jgi:DNA-binding NarL/FixJ family response regulator
VSKKSDLKEIFAHELIHALHMMYGAQMATPEHVPQSLVRYKFTDLQGKQTSRVAELEEIMTVGLMNKIMNLKYKGSRINKNVVEYIKDLYRKLGLKESVISHFLNINENAIRCEQQKGALERSRY